MLWSLALFGFVFASAQGRAVNISNTWVLPEEGFPVFYRYFRDRISWYEADAVCQFHHANLVTVDTTAQYDAVRAYLKELDISSAVWVGLIRSNPDGDFTWTDYRGLSGDGYWSSAPDPRSAPLCAAADPAADYRWEARGCGGPTVASFICELPVPQWALGNEGCMVRELPALTVLYLPESAAVQLTADCGLAGVKKVQCTGNLKREDLLRGLSCADEDDQSSTPSTGATTSTYPSVVSSDNPFADQDAINEITTEDNITTEHEDDINQSTTIKLTEAPDNIRPSLSEKAAKQIINNVHKILLSKNMDLDDSLQSNDIPKFVSNDNYLPSDLSDKLEDETHKQHKIIHDEIARHGNFETIFTQPTDHFVPPLVMAKAKMSDDMTVLSLEEKHAQQIAEQRYSKHIMHDDNFSSEKRISASSTTSNESNDTKDADRPLITTSYPTTVKADSKKDVVKTTVPKKYSDKIYGLKTKSFKVTENKSTKSEKLMETTTSSQSNINELGTTTPKVSSDDTYKIDNEPTIDLTVVIKEPNTENHRSHSSDITSDIPKIKIIQNDTSVNEPEIKISNPVTSDGEITQEISVKLPTPSINNFTLNHEVIKITILKEEDSSEVPIVLEVTTKVPVFDDSNTHTTTAPSMINHDPIDANTKSISTLNDSTTTTEKIENLTVTFPSSESISTTIKSTEATQQDNYNKTTTQTEQTVAAFDLTSATTITNDNMTDVTEKNSNDTTDLPQTVPTEIEDSKSDPHDLDDMEENYTTDQSETIDDFQSPLLSGANEPLHKPNRSRRPQPANRINKFNPFRILG